jgi:hypothetical protein
MDRHPPHRHPHPHRLHHHHPPNQPRVRRVLTRRPDTARTAYILCAGTDESQGTQDRCQQRVWGVSFREDDSRWDCLHMGNRTCGPDTMIVTTTTTTTR